MPDAPNGLDVDPFDPMSYPRSVDAENSKSRTLRLQFQDAIKRYQAQIETLKRQNMSLRRIGHFGTEMMGNGPQMMPNGQPMMMPNGMMSNGQPMPMHSGPAMGMSMSPQHQMGVQQQQQMMMMNQMNQMQFEQEAMNQMNPMNAMNPMSGPMFPPQAHPEQFGFGANGYDQFNGFAPQ